MPPIKSLIPIAKWLLRFSAIAIIYRIGFLEKALLFSFDGIDYLMALSYSIITILLVVGGFKKTARLTVVSGLLLVVSSVIYLFSMQVGFLKNYTVYFQQV